MLWSSSGTYVINATYGTSEENTSFYFELLDEQVEQPIDAIDNPTNLDLYLTDYILYNHYNNLGLVLR